MSTHQLAFWILRISVGLVFFGRGYQHLRWDVPYGALFRSEFLLGPLVQRLGGQWQRFANAPGTERWLDQLSVVMGLFFIACGVLALWHHPAVSRFRRTRVALLLAGGWALLGLAALSWLDSGLKSAMFIEHASQFMGPMVLVYAARADAFEGIAAYLARLAIALTFAGHGAFALGWYGVSGHFVIMTMNILGVQEVMAIRLLFLAGVFDMVVAVWVVMGIFRPRTDRVALMYAALWGTTTAFARLWSGIDAGMLLWGLDLWLHETAFRLIHGGLPLALYLIHREDGEETKTS